MARVKRAVNAQKKRRTILKASKGYRGQRSRLYRKAKEQQLHSLSYAYRDRRARKGEFRKLWISRINAAAQRGLDQVGPLGEEPSGAAPTDVAVQLDRRRHPVGALGERQAASPASAAGALTSSGNAALATSTNAVKAAASLTAISARFLRSTSTPAAFKPWMRRL